MTPQPPIALVPYAAAPGGEMLYICKEARYASTPPALLDFCPADVERARWFLALLSRKDVACPAEAVMRYRDVFVLDGKQILLQDGRAVAESYENMALTEWLVSHQHNQLARIRAGVFDLLDDTRLPVVALFHETGANFGHVLVEMLPKLLHLAAAGVRRMRLLIPQESEAMRSVVEFALGALGLAAEFVPCPAGSILRVSELHWVSPVARHEARKSPTLLRLAERLRAAAPAPTGPTRLYVARPEGSRRRLTNAVEIQDLAQHAGYAVVEPSRLSIGEQIALFAGAHTVAGPMGAALTLSVMMPPGSRIGMFEGGNCDPFFWDLACLAGHRFHWAFTRPVRDYDMAMLDRDMTIDPLLMRRMLAVLVD